MPNDSWDNPGSLGRLHKRMVKASFAHLRKALENGDGDSVEAWSRCMVRHSRELLMIMQFKRLVLLDVYGLERRPAYESEAQAWLPPSEPSADDREP